MSVMLFRFVSLSLFFVYSLHAGYVIVPGDTQYYKVEDANVTLLYTEQNRYAAQQALRLERPLQEAYKHSFGYSMDEPLTVGILSEQNQVANGFVTPFPYNLQMNYIGGSLSVDTFTTTSWLNTLLYHETTHNYQVNAKASKVTQTLHTLLGNGAIALEYFPIISLPNGTITSNLLEGNAVLNESWHGNGGRLYSGRFKAATILQAKAGNINAPFLYNEKTHAFPYYDRHYIVGGFFQLYLAEKYGVDGVNRFFYNHSKSWLWPFQINNVFRMSFAESYEEALAGFNMWLLAKGENLVEAKGKPIAHSKRFASLNSSCDKVFFLSSDAQRAPELVRLYKNDLHVKKERRSFAFNKVINKDDKYYTQSSAYSDASHRYIGLFDANRKLKEGSESKVIQGYLRGGVAVYFDVPSSFDQPQLYVGDTFYTQVNSSVFIDQNDNLYYFKQKEKTRTLYKNRTAMYSYQGYYGIVSDVDAQGAVYFVASSPKGSSLFRFNEGEVERVSQADNVVEARLVNNEKVLIAAVGREDYYYVINDLEVHREAPYEEVLFFEKEAMFAKVGKEASQQGLEKSVTLEEPYNALFDMRFGASIVSLGVASKNAKTIVTYNVAALLSDPLLSNTLLLFVQQGLDEVGTAGLSYTNDVSFMEFSATLYGVYNSGDANSYHHYNENNNTYESATSLAKESRGYGISGYMKLPVIKRGYDRGDLLLNYYQDYDNNARSPLSVHFNLSHVEKFGESMYSNYSHTLSLFGSYERKDFSAGFEYGLSHDLGAKFFVGMRLKGVRSAYERKASVSMDDGYTRGVKFSSFQSSTLNDPATMVMPTLAYTRFVKQAGMGELFVKKQFDARLLFFTFPFSLVREGFYIKQRYFDIQDYGQSSTFSEHTHYNETTLGATLDVLFMNRLVFPLTLEYLHNNNTQEKDAFRFSLGSFLF